MRFSGTVGFGTPTESAPGVWRDVITERTYFGDVIRNARRLDPATLVPPETAGNLVLENSISILADAEAFDSYMNIKYIKWEGNYWTVTNVEVRRPRLILAIGGLWNADTGSS